MQLLQKCGRPMLRALLRAKIVVLFLLAPAAHGASLIVSVEDVHPGTGSVRVALYSDAAGFRHEERAVQVL